MTDLREEGRHTRSSRGRCGCHIAYGRAVKYIQGMKYQLVEDYSVMTPVTGVSIADRYFELRADGMLVVFTGFGWDGASGPTFDTASSMTASMVHDVFCICMRDGRLSYDRWQDTINEFFKTMCVNAGMWPMRAAVWHAGVEFGDAGNPNAGPDRPVLFAP